VLKIAKEPISMETPIGDDDDSHLGDFLDSRTPILGMRPHLLALQSTSATEEGLAGMPLA